MRKWLLIALLALAPVLANAVSQPVMATTTATTTPINATVEGENIFNLKVNGNSGSVETYNATNHVSFDVMGAGQIELTDQDGNVLYSFDKTSTGLETINTDVTFPAIGTYVLTATVTGQTNTGSQSITVTYKTLPIIPPGPGPTEPGSPGEPGAPNTGWLGVIYVAGYAVPLLGIIVWLVVLSIIAFGIVMIIKKSRKNRSKVSHLTA